MENYILEKAKVQDLDRIWEILQSAIERRRQDGSEQWQDGYPNPSTIKADIEKSAAFVLKFNHHIIGYCAILKNDEPAYEHLDGKWLSTSDYFVVHRMALAPEALGKGLAKFIFLEVEKLAIQNQIFSIKVDTNYDNQAMLAILQKLGYQYCGEVSYRNSPRKAFEKTLS